jgi:high-affinity Fe2+/Pb2+ permease
MTNHRALLENWAQVNIKKAQWVLALLETSRLLIGLFLGYRVLHGAGVNELILVTILTLSTFFVVMNRPVGRRNFSHFFRKAGLLSLCSFVLSFTLGGVFSDHHVHFSASQVMAFDVLTEAPKSGLLEEAIKETKQPKITLKSLKKNKAKDEDEPAKRWPYILLFLLALPLTYFGLILSCSLSCSGYGILAILTFVLTSGVFSGGIFFLIKALRKKASKKYKNMSREERKGERKNFLLVWVVTAVGVALTILLGNIFG